MSLFVRLLLFAGGLIAYLFIAPDDPRYPVMQVIFGIFVVTILVGVVACRREIKNWFSVDDQE